ncbi:hypothetical protein [Paenibacillus sp. DYY-L-2]|uniref:hypothetical protein n=1 Tax=Paenibacillus sp. DYY-L-2 TaxID=3447013 RepID=UPI003F505D13
MDIIRLNELLPLDKKVTTIQTGSELLLAYELDKYAKSLLNKKLVLSDVTISEELLIGEHFSFVWHSGLDVGFTPDKEVLAECSVGDFFLDSIENVVFKKYTDDEAVYDYDYDTKANRIMNYDSNRSKAYVSLVAYIFVRSYKDSVKVPQIIIDHKKRFPNQFEYIDLYILMRYGNCLLEGLLDIKFLEPKSHKKLSHEKSIDQYAEGREKIQEYQFEWIAYVKHWNQRGWMNEPYSVKQKFTSLSSEFEVGDVVLLYERDNNQRKYNGENEEIGKLLSCYPAVIREFNKNFLRLTYYPRVYTLLSEEMKIESFNLTPENLREINMLSYERVKHFRNLVGVKKKKELFFGEKTYFIGQPEKFDLVNLGVGRYTYDENKFIVTPIEHDGSYQFIFTEEGIRFAYLSTIDTIYHVFDDYEVEYNKKRFLDKHYYSHNREPGYSIKIIK